jgi:FAD:protein FMN transferase
LSRFNPGSELSRLNQNAGKTVRVSRYLFDAVEAALWAANLTGGFFDPTMLKALEIIGYDRSFEWLNHDLITTTREALPREVFIPRRGRYRDIGMNRANLEISLPAEVQLDLGGIGKGWTVDLAAEWLAGNGPFLINAGGDIYGYGAPPGEEGWLIGVESPFNEKEDIAEMRIRQRAVATSTTARRRWQKDGRDYHHLLDPRTGLPADTGVVSATVIAPRVHVAEVCAKAALIAGEQEGLALLNSLPEVEGLLIMKDGRQEITAGLANYLR